MDDTLAREPETWQRLFEQLTHDRRGEDVTIEILDQELGDQTEAERMPLGSIDYDPRGDVVVVALEGRAVDAPVALRHLIHHPREVGLLHQPEGTLVMRIVDESGTQTLITVRPR